MITTKAVIRFATHTSVICVDDSATIHVFKYASRVCDFDVFTEHEQDLASEYIMAPPASMYYYVSFPDEIPPHLIT